MPHSLNTVSGFIHPNLGSTSGDKALLRCRPEIAENDLVKDERLQQDIFANMQQNGSVEYTYPDDNVQCLGTIHGALRCAKVRWLFDSFAETCNLNL
jgi:hypothetical protein